MQSILKRALNHYHETGDCDFYIGKNHVMIGLEVVYICPPGALNYLEFPLDY